MRPNIEVHYLYGKDRQHVEINLSSPMQSIISNSDRVIGRMRFTNGAYSYMIYVGTSVYTGDLSGVIVLKQSKVIADKKCLHVPNASSKGLPITLPYLNFLPNEPFNKSFKQGL